MSRKKTPRAFPGQKVCALAADVQQTVCGQSSVAKINWTTRRAEVTCGNCLSELRRAERDADTLKLAP